MQPIFWGEIEKKHLFYCLLFALDLTFINKKVICHLLKKQYKGLPLQINESKKMSSHA
jgi:hypothetical protein